MDTKQVTDLLERYEKGTASAAERKLLEHWFVRASAPEEHDEAAENYLGIQHQMWLKIYAATVKETPKRKITRKRIIAAAAILIAVLSTFVILNSIEDSAQERYANDIPAPKGNHATITLANGKTITLNDTKTGVVINATKLTYSDGSKIENPAIGGRLNTTYSPLHTLTVTTPRGGQYQITLPDGTIAQMNAGSSLTFPANFAALKERAVQMTGEIYFTVVHNSKQPFRVISRDQVVEDIGTQFNINAYADEPTIKTTLVEGSAKVQSSSPQSVTTNDLTSVILTPNNQSTLQGGSLRVNAVDPSLVTAWKNGKFRCKNETLESLMRKISRWYNVEVIYEDNEVKNQTFTGTLSRFASVSEILKRISLTGEAEFKIEGRKIIVTK